MFSILLFLCLFAAVLLVFEVVDRKRGRPSRPFNSMNSAVWGAALILASVIAAKTVPIDGHGISLLLIYPMFLAFAVGLFLLLAGLAKWISGRV